MLNSGTDVPEHDTRNGDLLDSWFIFLLAGAYPVIIGTKSRDDMQVAHHSAL